MRPTVAIIHGAAEGSWHSKKMRHVLWQNNFKIIDDPSKAEIIITHSGGCLLVPLQATYSKLLLINPTYWPDKKPHMQALAKIYGDVRFYLLSNPLYYFQKTFMNIFYGLIDWQHSRDLLRKAKQYDMPNSLPAYHANIVIARNDADTWCSPDVDALRKTYPDLQVERFAGDHDDCWQNPAPYINLLQSEYATR